MFLATEQMKKRCEDGPLPVEYTGRGEIERVEMDRQQCEQVREKSNRHCCAGEAGESDEVDEARKQRSKAIDAIYLDQTQSCGPAIG